MTRFDCTRSSPFQLHLRLHLLHPKPRVHVPRYLHESTLSYLRCLLKKSVACFLCSLVVESPQPLSFQILSLTDFFCPFFWDFNCYEIFWSCVRCILFFFPVFFTLWSHHRLVWIFSVDLSCSWLLLCSSLPSFLLNQSIMFLNPDTIF